MRFKKRIFTSNTPRALWTTPSRRSSRNAWAAFIVLLTAACGNTSDQTVTINATDLNTVDHLVLGVRDLESGILYIEQQLGVRAKIGGKHPDYGTHNALIALGDRTYLEIVADDPDGVRPESGVLWDIDEVQEPRLMSWAMRTDEIVDLANAASDSGLPLGEVLDGSRTKPNGETVNWRVTDPAAERLNGAAPFLIDWGDTPHPAESAPKTGPLIALRFETPEPEALRRAFDALDLSFEVTHSEVTAIIATIQTPDGSVELR